MTTQEPTRRTALLAIGTAGALTAAPFAAAATVEARSGDAAILAAWAEYQRLQQFNYGDGSDWEEARETAFYSALDKVEAVIEQTPATTPRGAVVQLWLSLLHNQQERELNEAIVFGNYAAIFARFDEQDYNVKLVLRAIRALQQMESAQ